MPEYNLDLSTYLKWGVFDVFHIPCGPLLRQQEDWIKWLSQAMDLQPPHQRVVQ